MKEEGKPQASKPVPDPADVLVKATETLVTGYERSTKRESLKDKKAPERIRSAVKRKGAGEYLFLVLLSFAGSVGLTRIFLELSGYPQIGNEELHIAHVLWGGLLIFLASLIPLMLSNPWVYVLAAVLSGTGMGLFIDEVGKFITQSNNYFFPAAAPIIYISFLLTAWLYLRIRRPPTQDPRAVMYRVFESLTEILDRDLDPHERAQVVSKLDFVEENATHVDLKRLAETLKGYLASEDLDLVETPLTYLERWKRRREMFMDRWIPRNVHKALLGLGLIVLGSLAARNLIRLLLATQDVQKMVEIIVGILDRGVIQVTSTANVFSFWLSLEAAMGLVLVIAALIFIGGKEDRGLNLSHKALVLYISLVNIFVFYFNQFSILPFALFQFLILWMLKHYQEREFIRE